MKNGEVTFICQRDEWPISTLITFSINTGARVVIRGYAEIIGGIVKYLH